MFFCAVLALNALFIAGKRNAKQSFLPLQKRVDTFLVIYSFKWSFSRDASNGGKWHALKKTAIAHNKEHPALILQTRFGLNATSCNACFQALLGMASCRRSYRRLSRQRIQF